MNETEIYNNITLKKRVLLFPKDLNKNLLLNLKKKIINKYEGKCTTEGFIKNNSIEIINRSIGKITGSNFRGTYEYVVLFNADVCCPVNGEKIKCKILNINRLGILAESGPLSIIVPKDYHEDKSVFKSLDINDLIIIEVIGKRFEINDTKISIVGKLSDNKERIVKIKKIKKEQKIINVKEEESEDTELTEELTDDDTDEVTDAEENVEELTDDLIDDDKEMEDELVEMGEDNSDSEYLIEDAEESDDFTYEK